MAKKDEPPPRDAPPPSPPRPSPLNVQFGPTPTTPGSRLKQGRK